MATNDISRSATDFRKHYKEVRAQQGRVFVDDDHNENERLHGEDERRSRVDIIGAAGSPDNGFLVSGLQVTSGNIDFEINPGTFYLGGLHLEMDHVEKFQAQSDFLQSSRAPVAAPGQFGTRFDLIYLEAWLQPVSAVEDNELFEVALGGPDTSTRMRLMRRVHVAPGVAGNNCSKAWQSFIAVKKAGNLGTINEENELVPDTKLRVEFVQGTNPTDLCSPPVGGGYLGAENQAIRVQLVDATNFTWGFDNAAPLYRVKVGAGGTVINMMNEPKDQAHWPLTDQTVELLPWSAVLTNNEKLAARNGFLAKVGHSYDPDTKEFTLATPVPANFGASWRNRPDKTQLGKDDFFYMRVWNRGLDTTSPASIPFGTTAVNLGQTGLKITISGNDRQPGDHWIIAARPESPNRVVPWLLEDGRAPHGYRRFYAPLGVIEWTGAIPGTGIGVTGKVHDCRETFRPLTRLRGCCTYTVGDGDHSHGDFTSIQTAIDRLPQSGGEICVLPGLYQENVHITGRHNIKIKGCGPRSRVKSQPAAAGGTSGPVFHIDASQHICLEALQIEAHPSGGGVLLTGPDMTAGNGGIQQPGLLRNITLERLHVFTYIRSGIEMHVGFFVTIHGCRLQMFDFATTSPAVYIVGDDVLIEENVIQVISPNQVNGLFAEDSPSDEIDWTFTASLATGGLHLAGGCDRVRVINNLIFNGIGNGITLGSVDKKQTALNPSAQDADSSQLFVRDFTAWRVARIDPCGPRPAMIPNPPFGVAALPFQLVAGAALSDILIERNRIFRMGDSGIAVDGFFDLNVLCEMISVSGLTIIGNEISHCLNRTPEPIQPKMVDFQGYGGIALAAVYDLVVRDNVIEDNGPDQLEPICGIFVLRGNGMDIERNRIFNNGARNVRPLTQVKLGRRGGINIAYAIAPRRIVTAPASAIARLSRPAPFSHGLPAVKIHDNIVSVPLGQALVVTAVGPVAVTDNHFTSLGIVPRSDSVSLQPATVDIKNLGVSSELWYQPVSYVAMRQAVQPPTGAPSVDANLAVQPSLGGAQLGQYLANGNVLFCDNQCELNLLEVPNGVAATSIQITSLDDIAFQQNQCDCVLAADDFVHMQAYLNAITVRATGNRFKESLGRAALSASTLGFLNTTTDNQSTHCLLVVGTRVVKHSNLVLMEALNRRSCEPRTAVLQTGWASQKLEQSQA